MCPEGHQPHTTNKAMIQLCSINGQHWSKVSTVYTPEYKNHWRPNAYGWVQRRHSKAGRDHRRVCTLLGKQLRQFIAMPLINVSPRSHRHGSHCLCEPHWFLALWRSLLKSFKQICPMASPTHLSSSLQLYKCHAEWDCSLKHKQLA